jgi:hypothetical protein
MVLGTMEWKGSIELKLTPDNDAIIEAKLSTGCFKKGVL